MKKISLLGSTGSIGTQTLDVIRSNPDYFKLVALSAGSNIELVSKQVREFKPALVSVKRDEDVEKLKQEIGDVAIILSGEEGLMEVACHEDAHVLVNAVIGSVGLKPTLAAIKAGRDIAIANKETLVTAGHIVTTEANRHGVSLIPVDSEHSAIFQALNGEDASSIDRLIITASGGSFRDRTREELKGVTVKEALAHPNWSMGSKITIDSATMMNKGLEVIEAHWLFNIAYDQIDVLMHRESIIHSMIEFSDRSVMAQLGTADMRLPIQYALTYPKRLARETADRLNLWEMEKLHFGKLDMERYRCMKFAYDAGREAGTVPTVLNAANEIAVAAFLNNQISFLQIEDLIEASLNQHERIADPNLEEILHADEQTRRFVQAKL
ncbi:1-deoxy-D-xylulose-5-phosphate reductoisomerase [Alkalicoccobacillus plakortidis]|uniref:1-deoxy-D-xylulose 5-phosphate reductoisomerase n=1 Tax=Alkalicoccobacillus plakortidis TaxID=444060 RepID=A0ABT0XG88_9BACI|nr:1-deoxy-D-xylulose-5-phosphate reductoisomerase [Alkalicoccobacillus plakortidis]MCM2674710.1 1-deoxy-D-xylulose-5-phosphate reductoisomerase [Alkalicoccobacillus plakortidis]